MSDLFKQLDSILLKKELLSQDYIEEYYIGNYMILRWISFIKGYDKLILNYINNLNYQCFQTKYDNYKFLFYTIPKFKNKQNYNYIKKQKNKSQNVKEAKIQKGIKYYSELLDIEEKDIKYFIDNDYLNINKEITG